MRETLQKYCHNINPKRLAGNNHSLWLTERYFLSVYKSVGKTEVEGVLFAVQMTKGRNLNINVKIEM